MPRPIAGAFAKAESVAQSLQHRPYRARAQAHVGQHTTQEGSDSRESIMIRRYGRAQTLSTGYRDEWWVSLSC